MNLRLCSLFLPLVALCLLGAPRSGQPARIGHRALAIHSSVSGQVRDLSIDSAGKLIYCTAQGEIGRIDPTTSVVTVLATTADGLPDSLTAVVETPMGDIAALHTEGDIWTLPGGAGPPILLYQDRYMIFETSDMIVDASGNFVICSKTPSVGTRAINWVDWTGIDWAYMLVERSPCALAFDPLSGNLLLTDYTGAGELRMVNRLDDTRPTWRLDGSTAFNFNLNEGDGDMAVDVSGNVYIVSNGTIYRHDRAGGTTASWGSGYAWLRGVTIAVSSGGVPSSTGWSLYVADGSNPTTIHEIGDVEAPANVTALSVGAVPNRGQQRVFYAGLRVYDVAVDNNGDLLVGGDTWGSNQEIRRIDIANFSQTTVAHQIDGIAGRVEGICITADDTIHCLTTDGYVQEITENPLTVTTVYSDPLDFVSKGKDMVLDQDGTRYVADREAFGHGEVVQISPSGTPSTLVRTDEARALTPDPFSAGLLVTEWNCSGFCGSIDRYEFGSAQYNTLPGLSGINYSNDWVWGDGDTVMDVEGNIYSCSEDDWRVTRYDPTKERYATIGSGYLNRPSGISLAASSSVSGSTTGWSLYVSEFDYLWENPSVPPRAPRRLDRNAPPVGTLLDWFARDVGTPRAMISDPAGGGLLVSTSEGSLLRTEVSTAQTTTLTSVPGGLDITGLTALSNGHIVTATTTGLLLDLDPSAGYSWSLLYGNPGGTLSGVRGLTIDGQDDVLIVDRDSLVQTSKLYRLAGGSLDFVANTARGLRPAIDPLTADVFVTARGSLNDGVGEVLRVDTFASPPEHGHWRGDSFYTFEMDETDGGIAFDADGNFYVTEGPLGRVAKIDRASGNKTIVAGNYEKPVALALAPGTPGIAGPQGTSLFVLDKWAIYEVGVPGLPAPPPPASQPGLAPPADFRVTGELALSTDIPFTIESQPDAGSIYIIFATMSGKVPGFPLSLLGAPDQRILPSNPDMFWNYIGSPAFLPGSIDVLDGNGLSPPHAGVRVGPNPSVFNLNEFFDVVWVAIDFSAPNKVAHVGGTGQIYLGN